MQGLLLVIWRVGAVLGKEYGIQEQNNVAIYQGKENVIKCFSTEIWYKGDLTATMF